MYSPLLVFIVLKMQRGFLILRFMWTKKLLSVRNIEGRIPYLTWGQICQGSALEPPSSSEVRWWLWERMLTYLLNRKKGQTFSDRYKYDLTC